jgi:hypothetical protein
LLALSLQGERQQFLGAYEEKILWLGSGIVVQTIVQISVQSATEATEEQTGRTWQGREILSGTALPGCRRAALPVAAALPKRQHGADQERQHRHQP